MPDHDAAAGQPDNEHIPGSTRRGILRGAAGLGAAGLAAAFLTEQTAGPAGAATADVRQPDDDHAPAHDLPLIAHVRDASTGEVDLFTGTRQIRVVDRQLAASLARAAR
jgi:hypothetical protein